MCAQSHRFLVLTISFLDTCDHRRNRAFAINTLVVVGDLVTDF